MTTHQPGDFRGVETDALRHLRAAHDEPTGGGHVEAIPDSADGQAFRPVVHAPTSADDPAVPEVFAAFGALGLPCLADAGVRQAVAEAAVMAVRRADAAPDLDAVRATIATFDEALRSVASILPPVFGREADREGR